MKRILEHTPELRAKQVELQARFNDLMDEIEKYPLSLVWWLTPDAVDRLSRTVALVQNSAVDYPVGFSADKLAYRVILRCMGEEEFEARKQINL